MRKPMVTRTIITTKVKALCLNVTTGLSEERDIVLPRTWKSESAMLAAAKSQEDTDEMKVVHIKASEVLETLYGIPEDEFIKVASVLPQRSNVKG